MTLPAVSPESELFEDLESAVAADSVSVVSSDSSVAPAAPTSIEQTGLSDENVLGLILKTLYAGELSGMELSDKVKISYAILERILEAARVEQLVEVRSASGAGTAGYRYAITERGRERAHQYFETNGYIGAAPVPLDQYVKYVNELSKHNTLIDRECVASGFTDLIVADDMLDQLGPAVSARRAMFLYGPPGNGKSAMSAGIGRALGGAIYMPYALDIDGQVVMLFDPVSHVLQPVDEGSLLLRAETAIDARWARIRRPVITVGGELTMDQLDLNFNQLAKFYEAPVQLKANCGVLLVDDFGRQRVPASESPQSVDCPSGVTDRLPRTAHRSEVRGSVRCPGHLCHKPGASKAGRRGVPETHSVQGPRHESVAGAVCSDIRDGVQETRSTVRPGGGRSSVS